VVVVGVVVGQQGMGMACMMCAHPACRNAQAVCCRRMQNARQHARPKRAPELLRERLRVPDNDVRVGAALPGRQQRTAGAEVQRGHLLVVAPQLQLLQRVVLQHRDDAAANSVKALPRGGRVRSHAAREPPAAMAAHARGCAGCDDMQCGDAAQAASKAHAS
jgi:hypothetical protein